MAENLKCNFCEKPATVHLTQIMNGKIQKVDLCEECAQNKGVADPAGFSLSDLLGKTIKGLAEEGPVATNIAECPSCGYTTEKMQKAGRMGCPDCYTEFGPLILPTLGNMHKSTVHTGKVPHRSLERHELLNRIQKLTIELQNAVKDERYEDAARLRDELKRWKTYSEGGMQNAD